MENNEPSQPSTGPFDINQIRKLLPHRYPMLLIDRVLEVVPEKRILARKCVTANENFFQGHFPEYPIMPGVLQIEAIAQAGALLMLSSASRPENTLTLFTSVERARFRRPVVPGDVLEVEVEVLNRRSRAVRCSGVIRCDGKVVCEAVVTCQLAPMPSNTPKAVAAE